MKRINWLYLTISAIAILLIIYFITSFNKVDEQRQKLEKSIYQEEDISIFKHRDFSLEKESKDKYSFKELIAPNGEAFLLKYNNNPLTFKKGDVISLNFDLDEPEESSNHFVVGYYLNDKFFEVFFDRISNKLATSFTVPQDGKYTLCIVGASAADLTITDGIISIK